MDGIYFYLFIFAILLLAVALYSWRLSVHRWINGGDGYKVASDGKTLVSADGCANFVQPSFKPTSNGVLVAEGHWFSNGHLNITGP
jgi:hypothetical protein